MKQRKGPNSICIENGIVKMFLNSNKISIMDMDGYWLIKNVRWNARKLKGKWYCARRETIGVRKSRTVLAHRIINHTPKGMLTDHINGNGLDNRGCNLRSCTVAGNNTNRKKRVISSSKYKGVSWDKTKNKWLAQIGFNFKHINIGRFDTEKEAAIAYNMAAVKYHKEFAKLNALRR